MFIDNIRHIVVGIFLFMIADGTNKVRIYEIELLLFIPILLGTYYLYFIFSFFKHLSEREVPSHLNILR